MMAVQPWVCTTCWDEDAVRPECIVCGGRGVIDSIPWADRMRDEVVPHLWVGGHVCQPVGAPPDGFCYIRPEDGFDLVVSLFQHHCHPSECVPHESLDPPRGVLHLRHAMEDSDLDPEHHSMLDTLAEQVARHVQRDEKVLVRCFAGLNRSSLVTALAMTKMGWSPWEAIARIRETRSPYALCNSDFVDYLMEQAV